MKKNEPIIIFGYSFPHRKTYDFLMLLFGLGFQNVTVIGAPKLKLKYVDNQKNTNAAHLDCYCVKTLCRTLKIRFEECAHDDTEKILTICNQVQAGTALISGSRIIKKDVIDIFENGIVNFHPGMIPETSGLDAFYYSIKKNCSMGVTVHLIDHKVDAGKFIFFQKLRIQKEQSIEEVKDELYATQLIAFRSYLLSYFGQQYRCPDINRPHKNTPLTLIQKEALTSKFLTWKFGQVTEQAATEERFFQLCVNGNLTEARDLVESNSYLINSRSKEGWSGIIISSFWQRLDLVSYLLNLGANPNDVGLNGTTVLMYAKTKIAEQAEPDMSLLGLLIKSGANLRQKDNYGKDIFDYLDFADGTQMMIANFLKSFK